MSKSIIVHSSWGEFDIDPHSGIVEQWRPDADHSKDPDYTFDMATIHCFDVKEWHQYYPNTRIHPSLDILDLGYWFTEPTGEQGYEPPDTHWRTHYGHAAQRGEL